MFTITFKGKPNPKDKNLVKLEMILFRTGYNRTPKVIEITGLYKDWDEVSRSFKAQTSDSQVKNKALLDLKAKYLKVAEEWEAEGVEWSPIQWSHCLEVEQVMQQEKVKVLSVSVCMDTIVADMKEQKRFKNGIFVSSTPNAKKYETLKRRLEEFTKEVYSRNFSTYFFKDINEKFIKDFVLFLQERGIRNGNNAGLPERLGTFVGVFYNANQMKQPYTDKTIFDCVESHFRKEEKKPQTIPYEWIQQIEQMDTRKFSDKEQFNIDLFLFSFYCGGIAPVDISYLTWDRIEDNTIVYERIKFPKKAEVLFNDKAKAIIKKYVHKCYGNYVLPIYSHKHIEEWQQRGRLKRLSDKVNKTLEKVSHDLGINKFTWYAARGTFITRMINEGYHPIAVAKFAGNSPQTIYKHYWDQTDKENVLNHMNQML